MFTGIVTGTGRIQSCIQKANDLQVIIVASGLDMQDVELGDSIAVNGVCLTVIAFDQKSFTADVSAETASLAANKQWRVGTAVNLEKALTPKTRLGGHMMTGHVDGCAKVVERRQVGESTFLKLEAPRNLAKYVAKKGSVALDGISLTVNAVEDIYFTVNIVPHTLAHTVIDQWCVDTEVNLEVDIIARYLERLMVGGYDHSHGHESSEPFSADSVSGLTEKKLIDNGFGSV